MARSLLRLGRFLDDQGAVARLVREAREHCALLEQVRAILPADAAAHCVAAALAHGHLRVTVDSPVWASRIRYMGREIGRRLGAQGVAVDRVTVQAGPSRGRVAGGRATTASLSTAAADCLDALAADTQDEDLRAALRRLARHGKGADRR
jgi:hypothetical protein